MDPGTPEYSTLKFDRFILVAVVGLLPLMMGPDNTTYDAAKFTFLVLAACLWAAGQGVQIWQGTPRRPVPGRLLWSWATLLLILMPGWWTGANPLLVLRTFAILTLFGWLALLAGRAPSRGLAPLLALAGAALLSALYGLLQMLHVLPGAPTFAGYPVGISTLGNQNFLAGFLALTLGPSWVLWRRAPRGPMRWVVLCVLALSLLVLGMSRAAGPPLALLMALLTPAPAGMALARRKARLAPPLLLVSTLVVLVGSAALLGAGARSLADGRQGSPVSSLLAANHGSERWTNWLVAWQMLRDQPLTGVGAGNFLVQYPATRANLGREAAGQDLPWGSPMASKVHNDILQWGAETGWLGLVWLGVHLVWFGGSWRQRFLEASGRERTDMLILTGTLLVAVYHSLVSFPFRLPASGMVIALCLGMLIRSGKATPDPTPRPRRLAGLLTVLLAAAILVGAVREFRGDLLVHCGRQAFLQARMEKAEQCLVAGVESMFWPEHGPLYLGLARSALGHDGAQREFRRSLLSRPSFEAYLALAQAALDNDDTDKAARYLERVRLCRPPVAIWRQARVLDGLLAWQREDAPEAARIFQELLAEDPTQHRALLGLGFLEARAGRPEQARAYYHQALEVMDQAEAAFREHPGEQSPAFLYQLEQHRQLARAALDALS